MDRRSQIEACSMILERTYEEVEEMVNSITMNCIESHFAPKDIAQKLSLSTRYIQLLIEDGTIPSITINNKTKRVRASDLQAFLESRPRSNSNNEE